MASPSNRPNGRSRAQKTGARSARAQRSRDVRGVCARVFTSSDGGDTRGMITARLATSRCVTVPVPLDAGGMREGSIVTLRRTAQMGHEIVAHEIVA